LAAEEHTASKPFVFMGGFGIPQTLTVAADAWRTEDAPDSLFAYVPEEARGAKGKKSLRKFPLASKGRKDLDPAILRNALARLPQADITPAERVVARRKIMSAIRKWNAAHPRQAIKVSDVKAAAASYAVGQTDESNGHSHLMSRDLSLLPEDGHTHPNDVQDVDPDDGSMRGTTGEVSGHSHTWRLKRATAASVAVAHKESIMDPKELKAIVLKIINGEMEDEAAKAFAESLTALVDPATAVANALKEGTVIAKADHEKAVVEAAAKAKADFEKAQAEKEAAQKAKAEADTKRLAEVTKAGLDPAKKLGKDRTVGSVVQSIPAGEEGDKQFAERLEEWKEFAPKTTAKADEHVATGGGVAGEQGEKPLTALV
jgi:hypothetical protein